MRNQIHIFGKPGCKYCVRLKDSLNKVIGEHPEASIDLVYHDLSTEDGVVAMCKTVCVNPSKIPAALCYRLFDDGRLETIPNLPDRGDDALRIGYCLGLQPGGDGGQGISLGACRAMVRCMLEAESKTPSDDAPDDEPEEEGYCESCHL